MNKGKIMGIEALTLSIGLSLHLGFDNNYNSVHPHMRFEHENYIVGTYYNSVRNNSTYVGYRHEFNNFGFEGAVVTGYNNKYSPMARITYDHENFRMFAHPGFEKDNVGVVIGLEFMIK